MTQELPPTEAWPEIRSMVKLATLFYQEGYSQREIAKMTGLSRSKVSRLLKKARQNEIIHVEVINPLPFQTENEHFLEQTFSLREAIVVPRNTDNEPGINQSLGAVAASYLTQHLHDNMILALSHGTTIRAFVDGIKYLNIDPVKVTIVPLVGGLTKARPEVHTNFLARELANALGGTHLEMYAPQLADSTTNRDAFMSDSSIEYVLAKARAADVIITGIGEISETSRLIELCSFTRADMQQLDQGGAVGELGSNFYNHEGQACCTQYNNRVVGLSINEVKKSPLVIGVAGGDSKIEAIHAILRGEVLDILITDDGVAKAIFERVSN
jgi:DNA-binding transcriptional regulator LsrR (DeoR family)